MLRACIREVWREGGEGYGMPSASILVAFCSDIPFICSSTRRGLASQSVNIQHERHQSTYVYATDSTVLNPPSTTSLISRADNPATPLCDHQQCE